MRKALATLAAAVLAVIGLPAATAQAEPACGTTPEQWVGYFPGFLNWDIDEPMPLDHTITLENGVLAVDTLINDWKRIPPQGTPTLTGDSLNWRTSGSETPDGNLETGIYTTDSVTCEGGVVRSFTGVRVWILLVVDGPVFRTEDPFSASR